MTENPAGYPKRKSWPHRSHSCSRKIALEVYFGFVLHSEQAAFPAYRYSLEDPSLGSSLWQDRSLPIDGDISVLSPASHVPNGTLTSLLGPAQSRHGSWQVCSLLLL